MSNEFQFTVEARDPACAARAARMILPHGSVDTPVFMPVGTQGTVKGLTPEDLHGAGAEIVLANTYHLYLRPGIDVLKQAGGLHKFMAWDKPLLTDSGGFQIFSLADLAKVTRDGVSFQSHIDGSRHFLTPETVVDLQDAIGADIIMCFDECTDYPASKEKAETSMRLTIQWARRCKERWDEIATGRTALFGIVQGSTYEDLRKDCAAKLVELDFPGYAIGGVSVGESKKEMSDAVSWVVPNLPEDKPRYLMGVGPPEDFLEAIEKGIDMFDCVMPTRNARNGSLFTSQGKVNIKNSQYRDDFSPLDPACACPVCTTYSRAYLSHLYRAGELLALRLNSLHNIHFMLHLASNARSAILAGQFPEFKRSFLHAYKR